jgi:hypothetical protein
MLPKSQHYVPRFLLRNFTSGGKQLIWAFDKHKDITFQTNIKNVAAERGFYDIKTSDSVLTLEPGLAKLEDKTSSIISELIKSKRLTSLGEESRKTLAYFLTVQFVRTKQHRVIIDALQGSLAAHLEKRGATTADVERLIGLPTEESSKKLSLRTVVGALEFVPLLLDKTWVLFETERWDSLYISDNPMTLHNRQDHRPYGSLGLAVPGIEIYFPLSTTVCLALMCSSLGQESVNALERLQFLDQAGVKVDNFLEDASATREFCAGVVNGTPNLLKKENVTMLNSLQVTFSSRFVYCETDNFDLVRTMIKDDPKYRHGLAPTMS